MSIFMNHSSFMMSYLSFLSRDFFSQSIPILFSSFTNYFWWLIICHFIFLFPYFCILYLDLSYEYTIKIGVSFCRSYMNRKIVCQNLIHFILRKFNFWLFFCSNINIVCQNWRKLSYFWLTNSIHAWRTRWTYVKQNSSNKKAYD